MRVDFHIHSCGSKFKDGSKVKDLTIENIDILVKHLNKNNINMCAISDHDNFEIDIYERLKKEETKNNSIQKVLPAVEFSVEINNKVIHIITLFEDSDYEKIGKIQNCIFNNGTSPAYDSESKKAFTEKTFKEIISQIELNVIMIAHQKNTIKSSQTRENDVTTLGEDKLAQLVFLDYFDVYEFKNSKNELFNKCYLDQNEKNIRQEDLRFITGTDCHDWNNYSIDIKETKPVYLKCLPSFRGVSLAVTDYRRIKYTDSFFSSNNYIKNIEIIVNSKKYTIPLSKGINAIIGDNSIGKSLLIHKLLQYEYLGSKQVEKKYEEYLIENNISINTIINKQNIYEFDKQGGIRKNFEKKNFNLVKTFNNRFPIPNNYIKEKELLKDEVSRYCILLETKDAYANKLDELKNFRIVEVSSDSTSLHINKIENPEENMKLKSLLEAYDISILSLNKILSSDVMENIDKEILENIIKDITMLQSKYIIKDKQEKFEAIKINIINTILTSKIKKLNKTKTDEEKKKATFDNDKQTYIDIVITALKKQRNIKEYIPNISATNIIPQKNEVGEYNFISKCSIKTLDNSYILAKLRQPFSKKNANIDLNELTIGKIEEIITNRDENLLILNDYENKVLNFIQKDFKSKNAILNKSEKDLTKEMSSGFNSKIYFDILSYDTEKNGIYIIDQPEDDVSPKAIKDYLLANFKEMSENRQIILITHNPQFIVNLDVDNVVFLNKIDNEFVIESGALEYKNENYDVLDIVSEHVDGGIDTIKGRWKKYEKGI